MTSGPADHAAGDRRRIGRRAFLGGAAGAGVVAAGGVAAWRSSMEERVDDAIRPPGSVTTTSSAPRPTVPVAPGSRTLVVVQLSGGNDGLNTLVPGNDGRYFDARPTLGVPEAEILSLAGAAYGLHPMLAPWVPLWDDGRLLPVDAVGFLEGQTRSHFQASDLWWSALPGQARTTGWLGRYLDRHGDPGNPLRAISLGGASPALAADTAIATGVRDPGSFLLKAPRGAGSDAVQAAFAATAKPLSQDPDLAEAQRSIPAAMRAVKLLDRVTSVAEQREAAQDGSPGAPSTSAAPGSSMPASPTTTATPMSVPSSVPGKDGAPPIGELTGLLDVAAGIIDLQIGAEIIVVGVSEFDTHANQAGVHPALLADLGTGVAQFLAAIEKQGRGDQVLVLTTSEFGRRVEENGSGTDHGNGGVQFLAGRPVRGRRVVGDANLRDQDDGAVRCTIDTRSMYAAALDWLGGDPNLTDDLLAGSFDRHDLVNP